MDIEEVKRVFQEHKNELWRYLCSMSGNPDDADDLLQTVFEKLLKLLEKGAYRGGDLRALIYRMANNTYIDKDRRRKSERRFLDGYADLYDDRMRKVEDKSEKIREVLEAALASPRLSQKKKLILRMRLFEGHSVEIIAQEVDLSQPTVYREIKGAFLVLKEMFEEAGLTPEDLE